MGKLLGLAPGALKDVRVGRAEVTFKVAKNDKNYNATDVVNKIGVHVARSSANSRLHRCFAFR